jgi:hypothetical protein
MYNANFPHHEWQIGPRAAKAAPNIREISAKFTEKIL